MHCAQSITKMAAYTSYRERNEYGLFLFFDNLKILVSTVSSFEEAERCNNLFFEDVDQAADRLRTAAETIQLLTADIGNNEDFTDVASILNLSLIKVRNLIDQLQQYRNEMLDFFSVKGNIAANPIQVRMVLGAHIMSLRKNRYVF